MKRKIECYDNICLSENGMCGRPYDGVKMRVVCTGCFKRDLPSMFE